VQIRGSLYNELNQMVQESRVYIRDDTAPGAKATVTGVLPFPDISGRYRVMFDLVQANQVLHQFRSHDLIIQNTGWRKYQQDIQLARGSSIAVRQAPQTIISIPLQVTNKSNFLWRSHGLYPMNLAYRWIRRSDQSIAPEAAIRTTLPTVLPVGHQTNLTATIKTPSRPGEYDLVISMVEEGHAWLDGLETAGLSLPLTIEAIDDRGIIVK
jgi:hypothetical protein